MLAHFLRSPAAPRLEYFAENGSEREPAGMTGRVTSVGPSGPGVVSDSAMKRALLDARSDDGRGHRLGQPAHSEERGRFLELAKTCMRVHFLPRACSLARRERVGVYG